MTSKRPQLGALVVRSTAVMITLSVLSRGGGFATTIILARLLLPEDFGLIALATAVYGLLGNMGRLGFQAALIRNQAAGPTHYNAAWTLTVIYGATIATLLALSSPLFAFVFADPRLEWIVYVLALIVLIKNLENVGIVEFQKEMKFERVFKLQILEKLTYIIVTISSAFILKNYWAFVFGLSVEMIVSVILSYRMHQFRPRFSLSNAPEVIHFGKWVALNNLIHSIHGQSDTIVIGRIMGPASLGYYTIARRISALVGTMFLQPSMRPLFPAFSKVSDNRIRLAKIYVDVLTLQIFVAAPIIVGIACEAELLIKVLFGDKWLGAVHLVEVLALYELLHAGVGGAQSLIMASGKPRIHTAITATCLILFVPLLVWGVSFAGPSGAAWALVAVAAVRLLMTAVAIRYIQPIDVKQLWSRVWRTLGSTIVAAALMVLLQEAWPPHDDFASALWQLSGLTALGAATYVASCMVLWAMCGFPDGPERRVLSIVRGAYDRYFIDRQRPTVL